MWKYLNESVEGTSHRHSQAPCQDSSFVTPYKRDNGDEVLILTCADGAGSSRASEIGSALACRTAAAAAISFLDAGNPIAAITDDVIRGWLRSVHDALIAEASRIGEPPRELASTVLLALIGDSVAAFAQVGD